MTVEGVFSVRVWVTKKSEEGMLVRGDDINVRLTKTKKLKRTNVGSLIILQRSTLTVTPLRRDFKVSRRILQSPWTQHIRQRWGQVCIVVVSYRMNMTDSTIKVVVRTHHIRKSSVDISHLTAVTASLAPAWTGISRTTPRSLLTPILTSSYFSDIFSYSTHPC